MEIKPNVLIRRRKLPAALIANDWPDLWSL
jgi:hypothetical protein